MTGAPVSSSARPSHRASSQAKPACTTGCLLFPGRMRGRHAKAPVTGGEACAQRSGRARIRRNLGLTPYRLPGCWPRWPLGPFRCVISLPRDVNDKLPDNVYPVQAACRCHGSVMDLEADPQYPAGLNELHLNPLHARSAADEVVCWTWLRAAHGVTVGAPDSSCASPANSADVRRILALSCTEAQGPDRRP
jgi:hypothetical protein